MAVDLSDLAVMAARFLARHCLWCGCAALGLVILLWAVSFGAISSIHPGFATSDKVDLILANSIEESIRNKLRVRCNVQDSNAQDKAYRSELSNEINDAEKQLYLYTRHGYQQPTCDELQ